MSLDIDSIKRCVTTQSLQTKYIMLQQLICKYFGLWYCRGSVHYGGNVDVAVSSSGVGDAERTAAALQHLIDQKVYVVRERETDAYLLVGLY